MSTEILKLALLEAQKREMAELPSEEELSKVQVFSTQFENKMRKLINGTKNKYLDFFGFNIRKSAAIFVAIVVVISSALSVEAVRKPIINFFIEIFETFSRLSFTNEDEIVLPIMIEDFYAPNYIPTDYYILEENNYNNLYELLFTNDIDEIIFEQFTLESRRMVLDTEDVSTESVIISGNEGITFNNKNTNVIIWNNGKYGFKVTGKTDLNELKNMANSVEIKK